MTKLWEDPPLDEAAEKRRALILLKYRPVCICNGIRYARVKEAIDGGAKTIEAVARETGCTTGGCGGERCIPILTALLPSAPCGGS